MANLKQYLNYLSKWIEKQVVKNKLNGVLVGVSGGVDSALVAAICLLNPKIKPYFIYTDIENSQLDKKCINDLENYLQKPILRINLKNPFEYLCKELECKELVAKGNIKARLRMICLYNYAQVHKLLVLGTTNADERYLGYFTKFGDGACDVQTIVNLTKKEIYEAARMLKLPKVIIDRQPTASLYENQTDQTDLGLSYDEIDEFLLTGKSKNDSNKNLMVSRHKRNQHKLYQPPKPKPFSKLKI